MRSPIGDDTLARLHVEVLLTPQDSPCLSALRGPGFVPAPALELSGWFWFPVTSPPTPLQSVLCSVTRAHSSTAGVEHMARAVLISKAIAVRAPQKSAWHKSESSAELRAVAAATWFLASDECTRQICVRFCPIFLV